MNWGKKFVGVILGWSCIPCWQALYPSKSDLNARYMFVLDFAKQNNLEVSHLKLK